MSLTGSALSDAPRWKRAVTPTPPPSVQDVAIAGAVLVAVTLLLLASEIGLRALEALHAGRHTEWHQLIDFLFDPAKEKEPSLFQRLHTLITYGLLVGVAIALGTFLYRLLAYFGILDPDLVAKLKESLAGKSEASVANASRGPGSAASSSAVARLVPAILPVAALGGAAAGGAALMLHVATPDPWPLALQSPPSIPVKLEPVAPVQVRFDPPLEQLRIPVNVDIEAPSIPATGTTTVTLDASALNGAAKELAKTAAAFSDASVKLKTDTDERLQKLTDASGYLMRTTDRLLQANMITSADLEHLSLNSVTTQYLAPRPCTEDYFAKLNAAQEPQLREESRRIHVAYDGGGREKFVGVIKDLCGGSRARPK